MESPATSNRALPRHMDYVVLKLAKVIDRCAGNDCFPGIVSGRVMGGVLDGQTIELALRKTLTNQRVTQVAALQNTDSFSHTPIGGYVAFEGVRSGDTGLTARWMNRMGGPDSVIRSDLPMQISPVYGKDSQIRRFRSNGATMYNAQILHVDNSTTASSSDALRAALIDSLNEYGLAFVACAPADNHQERQTYYAYASWRDGIQNSSEAAAEEFLERHGKNTLEPYFAAGANIDVIPMETLLLGSKVCESIDAGGRSSVPVSCFMTGGLGRRIEFELRRAGPEIAEKMENAFLAQADSRARESFASVGWKGVWNSDISQFFATAGIQLPHMPKYGFAVSTAVLQPYANSDGELFLAKVRPLSHALPRDAIPTHSDRRADRRFAATISAAVTEFAMALPDSPSIERENRASQAKLEASIQRNEGVGDPVSPGDTVPQRVFSGNTPTLEASGIDGSMNF